LKYRKEPTTSGTTDTSTIHTTLTFPLNGILPLPPPPSEKKYLEPPDYVTSLQRPGLQFQQPQQPQQPQQQQLQESVPTFQTSNSTNSLQLQTQLILQQQIYFHLQQAQHLQQQLQLFKLQTQQNEVDMSPFPQQLLQQLTQQTYNLTEQLQQQQRQQLQQHK